MISQTIQNAQSIDDVVNAINEGGTSSFSGNELAGQYAYDAADDAGYGFDDANLDAHLDALTEAGAEFDYSEARTEAQKIKKA